MKRIFIYFSLFMGFYIASLSIKAQESNSPTYTPYVYAVNDYGTITDTVTTAGKTLEAPLHILLQVVSENDDDWQHNYEWIVKKKDIGTSSTAEETFLDRYTDNDETSIEINESGEFTFYCYATFVNGNDSVKRDKEYWADHTGKMPLKLTVATSHLEFPNAFSPNGDRTNDTYGPKGLQEGSDKTKAPRSIVEYHMSIYNRWGQRLFDTHDINNGWDGTFNGRDVKQGVYYVVCTAKGSDGVKYNIKKDVNLLRNKRAKESSSSPKE